MSPILALSARWELMLAVFSPAGELPVCDLGHSAAI
jgi:hypothetical protein